VLVHRTTSPTWRTRAYGLIEAIPEAGMLKALVGLAEALMHQRGWPVPGRTPGAQEDELGGEHEA
jgi:hypothetical protein